MRRRITAFAMLLAAPAAAGVFSDLGPEMRVNDGVASSQIGPALACTPDGGFAAAWTNGGASGLPSGLDGSGAGVYLRRFGPGGVPATGDILVPEITAGDQVPASLAIGADGRTLTIWTDQGPGGTSPDGDGGGLFGRLHEPDGTPVGPQFQVTVDGSLWQVRGDVARWLNGYVVTWTRSDVMGLQSTVFVRWFDGNGTPLTGDVRVDDDSWSDESDVACDASGACLVAWHSIPLGGISHRWYASPGVASTPEVQDVPFPFASYLSNLAVDVGEGGRWAVAWDQNVDDESLHSVHAFVASASGRSPVALLDQVVATTMAQAQVRVGGVALTADGAAVTWSKTGPVPLQSLNAFGQEISATGVPLGSPVSLSDWTPDQQNWAASCRVGLTEHLVAWTEMSRDGSSAGVYARAVGRPDADTDGDGVMDSVDVCPDVFNPSQADFDADGVGDPCDRCWSGDDRLDADGDGAPDACDACPGWDDADDADGDGAIEGCDSCPGLADPGQDDGDSDARGDACDNCPGDADASQADADFDGAGDACDACPGWGAVAVRVIRVVPAGARVARVRLG